MLMGCIYDASTPNLCLTQASLSRFRYSKNDYYNINSFSDGANINTENLHIQCPIKFDKQIDKSVYISTYNTCSITQLGNTSEISTIISEK